MLFADKNALRTQLKVNMLRIRERELLYYTNNCLAISTSAALLAGFAWYGLTEVPFDSNANAITQTLYLIVTTLIMGLELLTALGNFCWGSEVLFWIEKVNGKLQKLMESRCLITTRH